MKPERHRIPLTVDERSFLDAVLGAAMDEGLGHVTAAAAVIANWPERADGLIDVELPDEERMAVVGILDPERLKKLGVHGLRTYSASPRDPEGRFDFIPAPPYVVEVTEANWKDGMICRAIRTDTPPRKLLEMFGDFDLDKEAVIHALRQADCGEEDRGFFHRHGLLEGHLLPDVRIGVFDGFYVDGPNAAANANVRLGIVKVAFEFLRDAGLCKLLDVPAAKGRKYARVYIDWNWQMYRPPMARRPPLPELSKADDDAIEGMGHEPMHRRSARNWNRFDR